MGAIAVSLPGWEYSFKTPVSPVLPTQVEVRIWNKLATAFTSRDHVRELASKACLRFAPVRTFTRTMLGISTPQYESVLEIVGKVEMFLYSIDSLGEARIDYDEVEVRKIWRELESYLHKNKLMQESVERSLQKLHQYQDIEGKVRQGYIPEIPEIRGILELKSADLELARSIVAAQFRKPITSEEEGKFKDVEVLLEFVDDVKDYAEDQLSVNFNSLAVIKNSFDTSGQLPAFQLTDLQIIT